jgi:hypothetical protein
MFLYTPKKVRKNYLIQYKELCNLLCVWELETWKSEGVITSFTPKIQAAGSSETSLNIHKATKCHIPTGGSFYVLLVKWEVS